LKKKFFPKITLQCFQGFVHSVKIFVDAVVKKETRNFSSGNRQKGAIRPKYNFPDSKINLLITLASLQKNKYASL